MDVDNQHSPPRKTYAHPQPWLACTYSPWFGPAAAAGPERLQRRLRGQHTGADADFTLAVTPPASLVAGGSAPATVTVTRNYGHAAALTLSLANPPAGVTGSGTLTLNAAASAPLATQTRTVSASDGTTTRTASFTVPVVGATTSWSGDYSWTCTSGQNCQSVYDLNVPAGAVLNLQVDSVSSGSVAQIALDAPGVALGGTNLLTGTTKELRCANGPGCSSAVYAAGELKTG